MQRKYEERVRLEKEKEELATAKADPGKGQQEIPDEIFDINDGRIRGKNASPTQREFQMRQTSKERQFENTAKDKDQYIKEYKVNEEIPTNTNNVKSRFINLSEFEQMKIDEVYKEINEKYENLVLRLQEYEKIDKDAMNAQDKNTFSTLQWKIIAISDNTFNFEALKKLYCEFDQKELLEIIDCHLLLAKYNLMQIVNNWIYQLKDYEKMIRNDFGRLFNYKHCNEEDKLLHPIKEVGPMIEIEQKVIEKDNGPSLGQLKDRGHSMKLLKKREYSRNQSNWRGNSLKPSHRPLVFFPEEVVDIEKTTRMNKNAKLNIFNADKEPVTMILIGHYKSGKSTLVGTILNANGKVSIKDKEEHKRCAMGKFKNIWDASSVMNFLDEEKVKGKTIEIGRADFETSSKRFTLFDCPGHKKYVHSFMSDISQADISSLVISAKPGEFESGFGKDGQTREFVILLHSLNTKHLIIIINKMDIVNWSEERYNYIRMNLMMFIEKSRLYKIKKVHFVAISSLYDINIKKRLDPSVAPWYKGLSLWQTFDNISSIKRPQHNILRIPILDKFKEKGKINTYAKIASGIVKPNMNCILMPSQKPVKISKIFDIENNEMAFAGPGENVNLHIKGVDDEEIKRGLVICGQQYWIHVSEEFKADISIFELQPYQFFGVGFTAIIHIHTVLEEIEILSIWKYETKDHNSRKISVSGLRSGEKGGAVFKVKKPICLEKYSDMKSFGRFVLRKGPNTIASGIVTRVKPLNPQFLQKNAFFVKNVRQGK